MKKVMPNQQVDVFVSIIDTKSMHRACKYLVYSHTDCRLLRAWHIFLTRTSLPLRFQFRRRLFKMRPAELEF